MIENLLTSLQAGEFLHFFLVSGCILYSSSWDLLHLRFWQSGK